MAAVDLVPTDESTGPMKGSGRRATAQGFDGFVVATMSEEEWSFLGAAQIDAIVGPRREVCGQCGHGARRA